MPRLEKISFYQCENKGADQLCSNYTADQQLYFGYMDSTVPLILVSKISSFRPCSKAVQAGLCGTGRKPRRLFFSLSTLILRVLQAMII